MGLHGITQPFPAELDPVKQEKKEKEDINAVHSCQKQAPTNNLFIFKSGVSPK